MSDQQEVKTLLTDGNFLDMSLAELQREHAELIAFNTALDRKQKEAKAIAKKYQNKVSVIADLLTDCSNENMTLRAIKTVIERMGES